MDLDIVFEDASLIIIDKPAGLGGTFFAQQPGRNSTENALRIMRHQLENVPRAGIVHRLDKDTSDSM